MSAGTVLVDPRHGQRHSEPQGFHRPTRDPLKSARIRRATRAANTRFPSLYQTLACVIGFAQIIASAAESFGKLVLRHSEADTDSRQNVIRDTLNCRRHDPTVAL
jgi:hypothetical protein